MRIGPLCVLVAGYLSKFKEISKKQLEFITNVVKQDTELTHPSCEAVRLAVSYVLLCSLGIIDGNLIRATNIITRYFGGDPYIKRVLKGKLDLVHDPKKHMGDVKIAFHMAYFFSKYHNFQQVLFEIIKMGGDTDTNACIAGYLYGALHSQNLPSHLVHKIISCDYSRPYPGKHLIPKLMEVSQRLFEIGQNLRDY